MSDPARAIGDSATLRPTDVPGWFLAELALFNVGSYWIQTMSGGHKRLIRLDYGVNSTPEASTPARQVWSYSIVRRLWVKGESPGLEDSNWGHLGALSLWLYCERVYEWGGVPLKALPWTP